jgi:hypothetical protein
MNDTICLPKEHYFVLFIGFILITLFYIYNLNKKNFKLDLNNALISESVKVKEIINKPLINHELEKRILLELRDRRSLNDELAPPERRDPEHVYPSKEIKNIINIPSRGLPDNYQSVGALVRKADEKILQLFGRQKYAGSNQWEYYVSGMDRYGFPNKMPVKVKGDRELTDKDKIQLDWLDKSKGDFEINLYDFDIPRYNPFDYNNKIYLN